MPLSASKSFVGLILEVTNTSGATKIDSNFSAFAILEINIKTKMRKINLLNSIKKIKRSISERKSKKNKKIIKISREYGYEYFDGEIQKRNIKPTKLLPLWDILGVTLGFGTAMLGEKAAMLCTASVEEVIDDHYKNQTYKLGDDEKELKEKIMKFRQDELDHKDIAYEHGATKKGLFGVLDKVIKTSSRIAITISEKI